MSSNDKLLQQWLTGDWLNQEIDDEDVWEPGFEADRQVVVSRLGPYHKVFERPAKFVKRFYHTLYRLSIEDWHLTRQISLYGGFCKIDATLDIRFQATCKYALANSEALSAVNQHIKKGFQGLIFDRVDKELHTLENGDWIKQGLLDVEKRIDAGINELMLLKNIQCRTLTSLHPEFADIEDSGQIDARFVHEPVYLNILQKNFEFHEKQQREQRLQQEKEAELKLQQRNCEEELLRQQQAQDAENARLRLLEKEQQQHERHEIEKRIHAESTRHVIHLRELAAEAELQAEEAQQARQFKSEQKLQLQKLAHQNRMKEKETLEEIKEHEKRELQWNESKQRLHEEQLKLEKQLKQKELEMQLDVEEIRQLEELKRQERLEIEKINLENRLKDLRLEASVIEQKKRFDATTRSADYLRREIELLVLEKQRAELNLAIKQAKQKEEDIE